MDTDKNKVDYLVSISKGIAGACPYVGPMAAEIIGTLIPNQRVDRIASLLKTLEKKLESGDRQHVEERIKSAEGIDIMEDGFLQAARALSEERIERLASLLKNALTEEQMQYERTKRLLQILNELNDIELTILCSYGEESHHDDDFQENHAAALMGSQAHLGSTEDEIDRSAVHKSYRLHLARLGLLKPAFKRPRKGQLPEFDHTTGMMKASGYRITRLGGMLLVMLDLAKTPY